MTRRKKWKQKEKQRKWKRKQGLLSRDESSDEEDDSESSDEEEKDRKEEEKKAASETNEGEGMEENENADENEDENAEEDDDEMYRGGRYRSFRVSAHSLYVRAIAATEPPPLAAERAEELISSSNLQTDSNLSTG